MKIDFFNEQKTTVLNFTSNLNKTKKNPNSVKRSNKKK